MPVRVLVLAANPVDTDRLMLGSEVRAIDERIQQGAHRDAIELFSHWAVRTEDLSNILMRRQPHVVHFSGHGSTAGIFLEDAAGIAQLVKPGPLGDLFRLLKDEIRCVVLNACHTRNQAEAIAEHIDAVVGTSAAIGDEQAIHFASGFYRAIADGRNLRDSFDLGVVEAALHQAGSDAVPSLLSKSNASDMVLTEVEMDDRQRGVGAAPVPAADALLRGHKATSESEIHSLINQYKQMITRDPNDPDAHYQLGLCYLELRLFDLAIKAFERALELDPASADALYYLALTSLRGRRPKILSHREAQRLTSLIDASISLAPSKAKAYYLAAIMKYDYYAANGLTVPDPPVETLLELAEAKDVDDWEIERLIEFTAITDEDLVSRVRGEHAF